MLLIIATIMMGLTAGIFVCWSISVMPGLAPLPDKEFISAFQSLNREIQNPLFFSLFLGTLVLLPASAWQQYQQPAQLRFWLLLAAAIVYAAGVFGLTIFGNVPLNEALDKFNLITASPVEIAERRISFEGPWNTMNNIRSLSCIVSFALTVVAKQM